MECLSCTRCALPLLRLRSFSASLKFCIYSGVLTGDFGYGILGGLLLVCASLIGFFQARSAA